VSTLAGTGEVGHGDGEGAVAQFNRPRGVAVDGDGNVIVADRDNHCIRKVTPQGHVSTLAGTGEVGHRDGGRVTSTLFTSPVGVAVDHRGNVVVADFVNHRIRLVASDEVTPAECLSLPTLLQSSFASDIQRHLFESGSFHDVTFVVEGERVHGHRSVLSARCEYFRSMFGAGFQEGDSAEIHISDTSSAAFRALLKHLYTDSLEVDEAVVFEVAKLSDQYRVERLHNHCLHELFKGMSVENAVTRLVQAHAGGGGEGPVWAKLKRATMRYVTRNLDEIWRSATASLENLDREHPGLN